MNCSGVILAFVLRSGEASYNIPMATRRLPRQLELFEDTVKFAPAEPMPAEFGARIRDELIRTLAQVREAAALPWKDLTAATE